MAAARLWLDRSPLRELTPRERQVLEEVAAGKSNQGIAASLWMTRRAVEKHLNAIFLKLGLANDNGSSKRVQAVPMLLEEQALVGDKAAPAVVRAPAAA